MKLTEQAKEVLKQRINEIPVEIRELERTTSKFKIGIIKNNSRIDKLKKEYSEANTALGKKAVIPEKEEKKESKK